MTRMFSGPGWVLDDGPCNNCGHCHDEDEPVTLTDDDEDTNPFVQLRMDDERSGR